MNGEPTAVVPSWKNNKKSAPDGHPTAKEEGNPEAMLEVVSGCGKEPFYNSFSRLRQYHFLSMCPPAP